MMRSGNGRRKNWLYYFFCFVGNLRLCGKPDFVDADMKYRRGRTRVVVLTFIVLLFSYLVVYGFSKINSTVPTPTSTPIPPTPIYTTSPVRVTVTETPPSFKELHPYPFKVLTGECLYNSAEQVDQVLNSNYNGNVIVLNLNMRARPVGYAFLKEGRTIDANEESALFTHIPEDATTLCILVADDIGNKGWIDVLSLVPTVLMDDIEVSFNSSDELGDSLDKAAMHSFQILMKKWAN